MKKIFILAVSAVFLTSCASGWSCNKRYCDTKKVEKAKIKDA